MHTGGVDRRRRGGAIGRRDGVGPAAERGHQDRRLGPAGGAEGGRRGWPGDVDLLHGEPGRRPRRWPPRCRVCGPRGRHRCHRRGSRHRSAGASGPAARRPRACTARAPGGRARRPGGGRRRPPRWRACRRTPRRWPAASPARHRGRTTPRRVRGRPARPTSSAGCAPTHRRGRRPATRAGRSCADPARALHWRGPRSAWSRRASGRRRRRSPRGRPAGRGRRRTLRRHPGPRAARCVPPDAARPGSDATTCTADSSKVVTASTIGCHPVQRHRWAASARCTAAGARRASGASAATRMTIPGVQNPHCEAPVVANAAIQASAAGRPASVVTSRPAARASGVTQATRGWPSIQTVQQPHWPCGLQPSLGVRAPRRSRSASRREAPSSATSTGRPSRRNEVS